jgi:hypothetical protein
MYVFFNILIFSIYLRFNFDCIILKLREMEETFNRDYSCQTRDQKILILSGLVEASNLWVQLYPGDKLFISVNFFTSTCDLSDCFISVRSRTLILVYLKDGLFIRFEFPLS